MLSFKPKTCGCGCQRNQTPKCDHNAVSDDTASENPEPLDPKQLSRAEGQVYED